MSMGREKETADNVYSSSILDGFEFATNDADRGATSDRVPLGRPVVVEDPDAENRTWVTVTWDGPAGAGECECCGRIVWLQRAPSQERDVAILYNRGGVRTVRCVRFACDPNLSDPTARELAGAARRLAAGRVADPSGAVDAWVEARDVARAGPTRAARALRPIPDPGVAEADDRPGALIEDETRDAVHEAVGRIATAVELARMLARALVEGGPNDDPRRLVATLGRVHEATIGALTVAALELGISVPRDRAEVIVCGQCLDHWDPRGEAYWWPEEGHPEPCEACGRLTEYRGLRVRR